MVRRLEGVEVRMNLLKKKHHDDKPTVEEPPTPCAHVTLIPRWDSAADIGHEDRATKFNCEACGATFTPDQAERLRSTETARVRSRMAS